MKANIHSRGKPVLAACLALATAVAASACSPNQNDDSTTGEAATASTSYAPGSGMTNDAARSDAARDNAMRDNAMRGTAPVTGDSGMMADEGTEDFDTKGSNQPVTDTWITTKVLAKLQTVDDIDNTDIGVETKDGTVLLTGSADTQALADAAVKAIMEIEGVKRVDTSMLTIGAPDDAGM